MEKADSYFLYLSGIINENQYYELQEKAYDTIESLPTRKPYRLGLANHQYPMPFQKRPEGHDEWKCLNCGTWNEETEIKCTNCGKHHDNARVQTRNAGQYKAASIVNAASKDVMEAVKKLESVAELLEGQRDRFGEYPVNVGELRDSWRALTNKLKKFTYLGFNV